jgi:hypothetical protein
MHSNQNVKEDSDGASQEREEYAAIQRWIKEEPHHQVWNAAGVMARLEDVKVKHLGLLKQEAESTDTRAMSS